MAGGRSNPSGGQRRNRRGGARDDAEVVTTRYRNAADLDMLHEGTVLEAGLRPRALVSDGPGARSLR